MLIYFQYIKNNQVRTFKFFIDYPGFSSINLIILNQWRKFLSSNNIKT
jgi:hypothetical protein